jgi:hypothetical protein
MFEFFVSNALHAFMQRIAMCSANQAVNMLA